MTIQTNLIFETTLLDELATLLGYQRFNKVVVKNLVKGVKFENYKQNTSYQNAMHHLLHALSASYEIKIYSDEKHNINDEEHPYYYFWNPSLKSIYPMLSVQFLPASQLARVENSKKISSIDELCQYTKDYLADHEELKKNKTPSDGLGRRIFTVIASTLVTAFAGVFILGGFTLLLWGCGMGVAYLLILLTGQAIALTALLALTFGPPAFALILGLLVGAALGILVGLLINEREESAVKAIKSQFERFTQLYEEHKDLTPDSDPTPSNVESDSNDLEKFKAKKEEQKQQTVVSIIPSDSPITTGSASTEQLENDPENEKSDLMKEFTSATL